MRGIAEHFWGEKPDYLWDVVVLGDKTLPPVASYPELELYRNKLYRTVRELGEPYISVYFKYPLDEALPGFIFLSYVEAFLKELHERGLLKFVGE